MAWEFREEILPGHIYRIKTDTEITQWHGISWLDGQYHEFQSRTANKAWSDTHLINGHRMLQAPQSVRINLANGKSGFQYPATWQAELARINSPEALHYLTRGGSGWVNKDTWPQVQALLFRGRNRVLVDRVDADRAYIKHFDLRYRPPGTYEDWNRHAFTVIDEHGVTSYPDPPGVIAWMPLALPCDAWIHISELTARPLL